MNAPGGTTAGRNPLDQTDTKRKAAPSTLAKNLFVDTFREFYRQGAQRGNSFVRQSRTICFSYRSIGLLDQKNNPAFAALGDLHLVSGLADEVGDIDHRQWIGAKHLKPV